jgi:hypothetical protein
VLFPSCTVSAILRVPSRNISTLRGVRIVPAGLHTGRGTAQAFSRRLPTAAVRVRAWVKSCGICGGQSGTRVGSLRVLRIPLPILIPPTAPQSSSSSSEAGTIGQTLVAELCGLKFHPWEKKASTQNTVLPLTENRVNKMNIVLHKMYTRTCLLA